MMTTASLRGDLLFVGLLNGSLELLDGKGRPVFEFSPAGSRIPVVVGDAVSPDGSLLAAVTGIGPQYLTVLRRQAPGQARSTAYAPIAVLGLPSEFRREIRIELFSRFAVPRARGRPPARASSIRPPGASAGSPSAARLPAPPGPAGEGSPRWPAGTAGSADLADRTPVRGRGVPRAVPGARAVPWRPSTASSSWAGTGSCCASTWSRCEEARVRAAARCACAAGLCLPGLPGSAALRRWTGPSRTGSSPARSARTAATTSTTASISAAETQDVHPVLPGELVFRYDEAADYSSLPRGVGHLRRAAPRPGHPLRLCPPPGGKPGPRAYLVPPRRTAGCHRGDRPRERPAPAFLGVRRGGRLRRSIRLPSSRRCPTASRP